MEERLGRLCAEYQVLERPLYDSSRKAIPKTRTYSIPATGGPTYPDGCPPADMLDGQISIADPAILRKARTVDKLVGEDASDQFPGESPQKSGVTRLLSTVLASSAVSWIHMSKIKKSLSSDSLAQRLKISQSVEEIMNRNTAANDSS